MRKKNAKRKEVATKCGRKQSHKLPERLEKGLRREETYLAKEKVKEIDPLGGDII